MVAINPPPELIPAPPPANPTLPTVTPAVLILVGAALIGCEKDRGGARRLERRTVFAVDEERQLACLRFFDPGDAGDFEVCVAFDGTAQFVREFGQFHCGLPEFSKARVES